MEIFLIRHGDPDYGNDCLTDEGVREADKLAEALAAVQIDAIYVSPLGRARLTCDPCAKKKKLTPVVLPWLQEKSVKRGDLFLWEAHGNIFLKEKSLATQNDWSGPGGAMPEGRTQFETVRGGMNDLLRDFGYERSGHHYRVVQTSDKRIALFCHKGVILTLLSDILHWALPMIYVSLHIHPTGVTRLVLAEKDGHANFKAYSIDDVSHLGSQGERRSSFKK